jgi:hypothetical protein
MPFVGNLAFLQKREFFFAPFHTVNRNINPAF